MANIQLTTTTTTTIRTPGSELLFFKGRDPVKGKSDTLASRCVVLYMYAKGVLFRGVCLLSIEVTWDGMELGPIHSTEKTEVSL